MDDGGSELTRTTFRRYQLILLQYPCTWFIYREAVRKAGLDPTEYGLHSLRSGGTTAAAAAKVPQRLLQRQSGWRSEAVNVYIQETLDNLLAPSEAASW